MGKHAKLKEKQKWSNEKFHLENARKLRGIYFIDPEDMEFKETIKNARKKLETSVAPAMPCKLREIVAQGYTALNTMYRKTPQKQTTFGSPEGSEKQIDYMLTKRRYLRYNKDAEADDMIHMGSGHRCVMAVTITTLEKSSHYKAIQ